MKKKSCGKCKFREYGTDSHYVCKAKVKREQQGWFRVRATDLCHLTTAKGGKINESKPVDRNS
jgi:hypothetical protein